MAIVTQGPQSSQPSRRELRSRASQQTQEVIRYSPDPPSAQPPKRAARSQPAKKVVTHAPREGAAKKKAGGNRGPSTQFQEDDDEEETGEGEEEEEVEAMRIEEEIQNTRRTRYAICQSVLTSVLPRAGIPMSNWLGYSSKWRNS